MGLIAVSLRTIHADVERLLAGPGPINGLPNGPNYVFDMHKIPFGRLN